MKIVIIGELKDAEALQGSLYKLSEPVEVIKILSSVSEAMKFLRTENLPDLVFCDVEVKGGGGFSVFKKLKINIPVIYCADSDKYLPQVLRYGGIAYLKKPATKKAVKDSIEKYRSLLTAFSHYRNDTHRANGSSKKNNLESALLVNWKDKIIPVKIGDIALFNIEYKMTQVVTFNNRKYFINHTLEDLEEICGNYFYRANRQFLINREAVAEASQHFARKLVLKLKAEGEYEVIISKNRVPEFLGWLKN